MSVPVPYKDVLRLWAPERWLSIRYDVSLKELVRWRKEGKVRVRVANRRKISIRVADVERQVEKQSAGGIGTAPVPCPEANEKRHIEAMARKGGMAL